MEAKVIDTREDKKDDTILQEIRERFALSSAYENHDRAQGVDDLNFTHGEGKQWPDDIRTDREANGRPCEEINKLPGIIDLNLGEIRQNKISIKVKPYGSPASKDVAATFEGMIRKIENLSHSDVVYFTAAEGAMISGRGAFRIVSDYVDDDVFEQELRLKRIKNPYSVYFDPAAEEWDKRDARYCIISKKISKKEYKKTYPKMEISSGIGFAALGDTKSDWQFVDEMRIAEYWVKEPVKKTLLLLSDSRVVDEAQWSKVEDELRAKEEIVINPEEPENQTTLNEVPKIVKRREVDSHVVRQYLVDGTQIIEGPNDWAGKFIPIIPVFGKEINIDGKDYVRGLVRHAKGPQRMYNYERNAEIERVALAKTPPVMMTAEQYDANEQFWDPKNNFKVALYNHIPNHPQPIPIAPPQASSGNVQQAMQSSDEIKSAMSTFDASLGDRSNETSGIAILRRQQQGNIANFAYSDNLARAVQYAGEQLVDLIPKIYDTHRQMAILGEDGTEKEVELNKPVNQSEYDKGTNTNVLINDLSLGKYIVTVSVGPHYSTKRQEAAEGLIQAARFVPLIGQLGGDIIMRNLDVPEADILAERMKKALPEGIVEDEDKEPTEEEKQVAQQQMQAQQELQQLQMQLLQAQVAEKQSVSVKNQASAASSAADAENTEIETLKAKIELMEMKKQILDMGMKIGQTTGMHKAAQFLEAGNVRNEQP